MTSFNFDAKWTLLKNSNNRPFDDDIEDDEVIIVTLHEGQRTRKSVTTMLNLIVKQVFVKKINKRNHTCGGERGKKK